ncbi:MAG: Holliday junction branch migration protein RuvA [Parachlamydiales bacterium]|nr:Holliday junction branch migration protein RuvA [Parachlamydiales bacterium]
MFEFIKGTLVEANSQLAILDVHGVGYKISIPANASPKLPVRGKDVILYTSMVIRETAHTLYGFVTKTERDVFEVLIDVSGIGPKIAVGLLGHMLLEDFFSAVHQADSQYLCKLPGIGKKTAERLILEIKDKLAGIALWEERVDQPVGATQLWRDAVSALINLGFQQAQAQQAVKKAITELKEPVELSHLIAKALKEK